MRKLKPKLQKCNNRAVIFIKLSCIIYINVESETPKSLNIFDIMFSFYNRMFDNNQVTEIQVKLNQCNKMPYVQINISEVNILQASSTKYLICAFKCNQSWKNFIYVFQQLYLFIQKRQKGFSFLVKNTNKNKQIKKHKLFLDHCAIRRRTEEKPPSHLVKLPKGH